LRNKKEDKKMVWLDTKGVAAIALSILLMLSLSTTVAIAQEDDDEVNDDEHEIEREVEVRVEANRVEIESTIEKEGIAGETENSFEIEFEVNGEVEIKLEYEEEFEYEDNVEIGREMKLEFEVEFESIIEFVDNNGDGLYNEGESVSVYELEDREFTPISYTTEIVDDVTVHKITTQTVDGVFRVTLHIAGEFTIIGGEAVRPTEVKIDIEIHNFPYTHENSKLALECKIESVMETEEEKEVGDVEEEIKVTYGNYQGFFSWKNTSTVDGVERPVLSTELMDDPEEGKRKLYLIYERGTAIVHDPKIGILGVITAIPTMPWIMVLVAAIFAAIVGIGAARYIVLRKG
jgi:hypothetical protein